MSGSEGLRDGYVAIWGNVCEGGVAEMPQRYTEGLTREKKVEEAASFDADIVAAITELREEKRSYVADDCTYS